MIIFALNEEMREGWWLQVAGIVTMRMSRGRDLVLDGGKIVIPRDTIINLPVGCPHTSSALFEEADLFRPERWLELDADYVPTGDHRKTFMLNLDCILAQFIQQRH